MKKIILLTVSFLAAMPVFGKQVVDMRQFLPGKAEMPDHAFPSKIPVTQENHLDYSKVFFYSKNKAETVNIVTSITYLNKGIPKNIDNNKQFMEGNVIFKPGIFSKEKIIGDFCFYSVYPNANPDEITVISCCGKFIIRINYTKLVVGRKRSEIALNTSDIKHVENLLSSIVSKIEKYKQK